MTQTHGESRGRQITLKPLDASMTDRAIWGGKATGLAKILGAALTLPETACIACQNVPHLKAGESGRVAAKVAGDNGCNSSGGGGQLDRK